MNTYLQRICRPRWLLLGSLLALLAGGSYLVGRYKGDTLQRWMIYVSKGEIAEVDPAALDFGESFAQEKFQWRMPIRNKSWRPLEIAGWQLSCHCTAVEPKTLTIPAGEMREIVLTIGLTSSKNEAEGLAEWDFAVDVVPRIATPSFPAAAWKVHGRVHAKLVCAPGTLSFGDSLIQGQPFQAKSFTVASYRKIECLKADWDHSLAAVEVRATANDGMHFDVTVTPASDLPAGNHHLVIDLSGTDAQGQILAQGHAYVQANVFQDMALAPCPLSFGVGVVGQPLQQTVTLKSRSQRAFSVLATHIDEEKVAGAEISEVQAPTEDGHASYRICLRPLQAGVHSLNVAFRIQHAGAAPYDVLLPVCFCGTSTEGTAPGEQESPRQE